MASVAGYEMLMDGFQAITKGMDSGLNPSLLDRQTLSYAVNCQTRGCYVSNRNGRKQQAITFPDSTTQTAFEDGLFQGTTFYAPAEIGAYIAVAVAGRIFLIDVINNFVLSEITPSGDTMLPNVRHVWMTQAEDWLCVQDGTSAAILFNGATYRRADSAAKELPPGEAMAYALGRLWVAQGRYYIGSDLMAGTDNAPTFIENTVIGAGGAFAVPQQSGSIVGFYPVANLDTSLGQGGLAIFTRDCVHVLQVPFDRDEWKNLTNMPLQSVALLKYGATSQESIVPVNSDLFFRSKDGIRSLQMSRRDFSSWGNVPISAELDRLFAYDDKYNLGSVSGCLLNNRLLMTCSPKFNEIHGTSFSGLAALDFDPISGITVKATPVYDGFHDGIDILQVVSGEVEGVDRAWAIVLGPTGKIGLWELDTDDFFDGDNNEDRIEWQFETGCYDFKTPSELKRLETAEFWYDNLAGEVDFALYYKPDQSPDWTLWHEWTETKPIGLSTPSLGGFPAPQYGGRHSVPQPADDESPLSERPSRQGFNYQLKLVVRGPARFLRGLVKAGRVVEPEFGEMTA